MRILHITPYYAPAYAYGGVVSAVTGLAQAQAERGHRVTVLTTDTADSTRRCTTLADSLAGVQVIRCRNLSNTIRARCNLSQSVGFGAAIRRLATEADIIHSHELRTVENLLISVNRPDKPIILSPHGTLPYGTGRGGIKRYWDRLFGRRILRLFDHVAALTSAESDDVRTLWSIFGVAIPPISIVPNGVSAEFVHFSPPANADDLRVEFGLGEGPIVLFLGRLHERKGLQFLIPAFAQAIRGQSDLTAAKLLIVGPDEGMLATAQALVDEAGIAGRVVFAGMLDGDRKRAAFAISDIFTLPAVGEGLSMAVLEALAAGLPAILTPGCNLPDLNTRGAGITVEREITPLAEALRTLLRDRDRRQVMGERGSAWVRETFTWPAIAEQTETMYREALNSYGRSSPTPVLT